jgi:anti-sigma factor RsiW
MKLVETDTTGPPEVEAVEDETVKTPPRPEHRRVSVSLLLTVAVLAGTVVTIYSVFPERHNALMTAAIEAHHGAEPFELAAPSPSQLVAWSTALLGKDVPWPDLAPDVEIVGVRALMVLNRRAAMVRYRIAGDPVTVVVQQPRDTPPRKHHRRDGDDLCLSWRSHKWTFIAVGPVASAHRWAEFFGAPGKLIPDNGH